MNYGFAVYHEPVGGKILEGERVDDRLLWRLYIGDASSLPLPARPSGLATVHLLMGPEISMDRIAGSFIGYIGEPHPQRSDFLRDHIVVAPPLITPLCGALYASLRCPCIGFVSDKILDHLAIAATAYRSPFYHRDELCRDRKTQCTLR